MRPAAWLSVAIAVFLALPILAVLASLVQPAGETWRHLAATVLSRYVGNTAALLVLVAAGVISIGVVSAWLVATYRFPGVRLLEWALMLPLAMPAIATSQALAATISSSSSFPSCPQMASLNSRPKVMLPRKLRVR